MKHTRNFGTILSKRKPFLTNLVGFVLLDFFRKIYFIYMKLTTLFFNFCFFPETKNVNENKNPPVLKPPKTNTFNWLKTIISLQSEYFIVSLQSEDFRFLFFQKKKIIKCFLENFTNLVSRLRKITYTYLFICYNIFYNHLTNLVIETSEIFSRAPSKKVRSSIIHILDRIRFLFALLHSDWSTNYVYSILTNLIGLKTCIWIPFFSINSDSFCAPQKQLFLFFIRCAPLILYYSLRILILKVYYETFCRLIVATSKRLSSLISQDEGR